MPVTTELVCSTRGCRTAAVWALRWNNPRLHTADRRKIWLACQQHLDHLSQFLDSRGFLRETWPANEPAATSPGADQPSGRPAEPAPDASS